MTGRSTDRDGPGGALFWTGAAVGACTIGVAVVELVAATPDRRIGNVVAFVAGAGVVHDLLWAPGLALAGAATRAAPGWTRVPIRVGLALSALVVLVTWPEVRGYARSPRNPSILPLDYGASLRVALVVVWAVVLGVLALRAVRRRTGER